MRRMRLVSAPTSRRPRLSSWRTDHSGGFCQRRGRQLVAPGRCRECGDRQVRERDPSRPRPVPAIAACVTGSASTAESRLRRDMDDSRGGDTLVGHRTRLTGSRPRSPVLTAARRQLSSSDGHNDGCGTFTLIERDSRHERTLERTEVTEGV